MKQLSLRMVNLICFAMIVALLGVVAYLEKFKGFEPCPLCILQRLTFTALGIIFLTGAVFNLKKYLGVINGSFAILFSTLGAFLAGRQVWIQHLPPNESPDCGASLDYMLQVLPWKQVLQKVLAGTSECSKLGTSFMALSLAEWSFILFCAFILVAAWQTRRAWYKKN